MLCPAGQSAPAGCSRCLRGQRQRLAQPLRPGCGAGPGLVGDDHAHWQRLALHSAGVLKVAAWALSSCVLRSQFRQPRCPMTAFSGVMPGLTPENGRSQDRRKGSAAAATSTAPPAACSPRTSAGPAELSKRRDWASVPQRTAVRSAGQTKRGAVRRLVSSLCHLPGSYLPPAAGVGGTGSSLRRRQRVARRTMVRPVSSSPMMAIMALADRDAAVTMPSVTVTVTAQVSMTLIRSTAAIIWLPSLG